MKKAIGLVVLFLFLAFTSMPTVIAIFEDDTNITDIYSISEEEESHTGYPEFKLVLKCSKALYIAFFDFTFKTSYIPYKQIFLKLRFEEIIIPPPELI